MEDLFNKYLAVLLFYVTAKRFVLSQQECLYLCIERRKISIITNLRRTLRWNVEAYLKQSPFRVSFISHTPELYTSYIDIYRMLNIHVQFMSSQNALHRWIFDELHWEVSLSNLFYA